VVHSHGSQVSQVDSVGVKGVVADAEVELSIMVDVDEQGSQVGQVELSVRSVE